MIFIAVKTFVVGFNTGWRVEERSGIKRLSSMAHAAEEEIERKKVGMQRKRSGRRGMSIGTSLTKHLS
jgi:hypothetical protein